MDNQFWVVILSLMISATMIFIFKMAFKALEDKDKTLNLLVITSMILLWIAIAYLFYLARAFITIAT